jgi:hypothetical protein
MLFTVTETKDREKHVLIHREERCDDLIYWSRTEIALKALVLFPV